MALSDRDRAVLDFERTWWTRTGPKGDAIRSQLGLSSTRYYQLLGALSDSPDAERYDPLVVRRLRRGRSLRRRALRGPFCRWPAGPVSRRQPPSGPARDGGTHTVRAVVLLVVVVVVAVVALKHVGGPAAATHTATRPTTTSTTTVARTGVTTTSSTTVATLPPAQVKVLALNGTLRGVLAGDATRKLKAQGYVTLAPDNTTTKVTSSSVYATSAAYLPSARAIASEYGIPTTAVSAPIPTGAPIVASERAAADVVLVIGPETAAAVEAG